MNCATCQTDLNISVEEKQMLRELAKRVAEIAAQPVHQQKIELWKAHNRLEKTRPLVLVFPEGSWRELLPESEIKIQNPFFRNFERDLRMRLYHWENLRDDNVIEAVIYSPLAIEISGWGIDLKRTDSQDEFGAYHIDPVIITEDDADRLKCPEVYVDWEESERRFEALREIFGDILEVKKQGRGNGGICPLDFYAQLRGIDNMMMDLVDKPEFLHRVVDFIVEANISIFRTLEAQGALSLGNRNHYVGSGGVGYSSELPQADFSGQVRTMDLWGFATAQIFSEVSPAMHEEFALQHEKKFLELFGLNCYGCCEPLHNKLDAIIRLVPRLRRISISPWANVERSAEILEDKYIFSWKPNPAILATETWTPEASKKSLEEFCGKTKNNLTEIIMKDTHTIRNEPHRMHEWLKLAMKTAEEMS